jgi:hypothetical protein
MQDRFFGNIRKGMDVMDVDGDKIGTVDEIFQPAAVSSTASTTGEATGEPILKVETGFLGLGKDYYVPSSAVRDVTAERVVLGVDKDELDTLGWDTRPRWLND